MTSCRVLLLISLTVLPVMASGCQSPRAAAKEALIQEVTARRAERERSAVLYQAGIRAYREERKDKAAQQLREAVAADAQNAAAWLALGVVEHDQRHFQQAAEAYRRAAKLAPTQYEPHYNLGVLFEAVGYYDRAIEAYETALELSPDNLHVIENLARAYTESGHDLNRAQRLVQQALDREFRDEWRQWLKLQALRLEQRIGDPPAITEALP